MYTSSDVSTPMSSSAAYICAMYASLPCKNRPGALGGRAQDMREAGARAAERRRRAHPCRWAACMPAPGPVPIFSGVPAAKARSAGLARGIALGGT